MIYAHLEPVKYFTNINTIVLLATIIINNECHDFAFNNNTKLYGYMPQTFNNSKLNITI